MPGGPRAQNGKGAQSDPNCVSRLLLDCVVGGGAKITVTPLMGVTENAGSNAKVQRNLGLDFVTKQHKSLQ